jgi:hypothetical protein
MNFLKFLLFVLLFPSMNSFAQSGCTDYQATNYDPLAVTNDGSCIYPSTTLPLVFKCNINSLELDETSGIVNQDNNFWSHVDDTHNEIHRIDTVTDSIFQTVTISNATNTDWEDIASDSNYIYIGDVGNNGHSRTNLKFYKILKSDITDSTTSVNADKINFTYSDQVIFDANHRYYDCEAFFILNDSIHMFTKGWANRWTKHYVLPTATGTHVAQLVDSFNVTCLVTSAAIQGDSLVVLVGLNYSGGSNTYVWMFNEFQGTDFFGGNKRRFSIGNATSSGQVEAICFKDTSMGYITNERNSIGGTTIPARLREFNLKSYLATPITPVNAPSLKSISKNLNACNDVGTATFSIKNITKSTGQNLHFTLGGLPSWVTATPSSDTLAPGDSSFVTLNFNSGIMSAGTYVTNIPILSNDLLHPTRNVSCSLIVGSNPCVNFSSISDTCSGTIRFTSTSINAPTTYYWDFGDGNTSTIVNPAHTYSMNGIYSATLIGCNAAGCDTSVQNVQATISGPHPAICKPVTLSFCCGAGITNFRLTEPAGDVLNVFSSDASVGYEDFTCSDIGTLTTNFPYSIICTTGTAFAENLKVWLDLNNDGMLDSLSEQLYFDTGNSFPVHTGTLTVPALPGNVYGSPLRLRVASDIQQVPQSCLNPQSGQHEDYSIILNLSTVSVNELLHETDLNVYPNPFNNSTSIDYSLKQSSHVSLEVFNILGEKVDILVNSQKQPAGNYRFQFSEHPAGIYFIKVVVNEKYATKRIVKTN